MTSLFKRVSGGGGSTSDTEEVAAFSRPNVTDAVNESIEAEKVKTKERRVTESDQAEFRRMIASLGKVCTC